MRTRTYNLRISDDAELDLDNAFIWYEIQKNNLGIEFITTIDDSFQKIKNSPKQFPIIYKNIRRHLIKKFPYSIYFFINDASAEINIIAVFHNSRNPILWKKRKI